MFLSVILEKSSPVPVFHNPMFRVVRFALVVAHTGSRGIVGDRIRGITGDSLSAAELKSVCERE